MRRGSVSVKEYIERMQERYRAAGRGERGRLLDEIVAVTGYHRKSATRLMARSRSERVQRNRRGRPRRYGPEVEAALRQVWEMSDRLYCEATRALDTALPARYDGERTRSQSVSAIARPPLLDAQFQTQYFRPERIV